MTVLDAVTAADLIDVSDEELRDVCATAAELVQRDSARAETLLGLVEEEAARRGATALSAESSYLRARCAVNQGRLAAALELIDRAESKWLEVGLVLPALRTALGRMHVLDDLGRHTDALEVGETLVAKLDAATLADTELQQAAWMKAAALENLGVGHGYLGDHHEALQAYVRAEATYREIGMEEETPRPMANRGVELIELGRPDEAIEALRAAAGGFEASDDRLSVAMCLAYEARAQLVRGDYLAAASATERASRHLESQETTTEYARTQLVRADTLASLNLLEEAAHLYGDLRARFETAGLQHDLAVAQRGLGIVLVRLDRLDEAWATLAEAVRLFDEVGDGAAAATARLAQSEIVDDLSQARLLADEARAALETSGRPADLGRALIRCAQIADSPEEASAYLEAAAFAIDGHILPDIAWRERLERGRLLLAATDLDAAREAFEAAVGIIDAARATVPTERERLRFMDGRNEVLELLLSIDLNDGQVDAAYRRAQTARARTLVERLEGGVDGSSADAPPVELDGIYEALLRSPVRAVPQLRDTARRIELDTLASVAPRSTARSVVSSRFGATPVVTYQALADELIAFVEVQGATTVVRGLADVGELRRLVTQLDAQWRRFEDRGLAARQHRHLLATTIDILQRLYVRLIAPMPEILESDSVLVVPCEAVAAVPFAALHDGVCHLIERLAVTVAPSVDVAAHAGDRLRSTFDTRLAVGVTDEFTPHVSFELDAVSRASADVTVLRDGDASVSIVAEAAKESDVVHIACHGIHRPDNPMFSALRLGDRWLPAAEIARWDLDGQLVVLSACSSGRQQPVGSGDELIGLPRAFLAAGAGAVVVNLWPAQDDTAAVLMAHFHDELRRLDPPGALRHAQIQVLDTLEHPYHWAPAVLFGAPRSKEPE